MSTKATSPAPIVADMTAESREPAPRWPTWARIIAPVAILLTALVSASLITAPIMLLLPYSNALESGRNLVASVLASVFTVALLWLYLSFVERRTLSFTGFRFTKLSLAMFGVGALASAAVLAAAAAPATATGTLRPYATDFEGVPTALVIALLIAQAVLLQGLPEELLFRGYLVNTLAARPWVAVGASTLLFTVIHLASGGGQQGMVERFIYLLPPFGFSLSAVGLALLTRSLWTAVGVHAGIHLATFAAVPFGLGDGPALWLLTGIGHALVGAVALTLWARRGTRVEYVH